ncbi:MAG: outer membrane beta-barrel protein [Ignavibacteriae bacterium]|nr:outer membrane beta-barrel protein [Ignavibacteriota bacterium]MCB9216209.1 outer membrane beta-barrel protein [Ignavibacteria bacterium]
MKYIYLTLFALLALVGRSLGQESEGAMPSTTETERPTESLTLPPLTEFLYPTDKVLGPASGPRILVGLFGGVISNSHSGIFSLREDGILCCQFDGASSVGPTVALRGDYFPDAKGFWGISLRAGWEDQSAEFESEVEQLLIFGKDNEPEKADFQNRLSASLSAISISPLAMFKLLDFDLYFSAGPTITLYSSPTFDKTEQILGPTGVTYLDGSTEVDFPDIPVDGVSSSTIGFTAGLDLRYPLTENIYLGSELHYRLPLTKITTDEEWNVSNIIATIGASLAL